jgi:hypothetical protein
MTGTLTDRAWADICAAAKPFTPSGEARSVLEAILFDELPAFAYDGKAVANAKALAARMLKQLGRFEADYRTRFPDTTVRTEADLWYVGMLRRRPLAVWLWASAIRRAHGKRRNVQHEWLYHRLCSVWLENFGAPDLTNYSVPPLGGPPRGPLIAFILAAWPSDKLPSPETVRDAVEREREGREAAKQLTLQLRKRMGV